MTEESKEHDEGEFNNGISALTNENESDNDSETEYLDDLIGIFTKTNEEINEKSKEIEQLYSELIQNRPIESKEESKEESKPEKKEETKSKEVSKPATNPGSKPASKQASKSESKLNLFKQGLGFKDTATKKALKDVDTFLKDDTDNDLNKGIYPELKINEIVYDKIKGKEDKEKLDSYVYYFFYILIKYIVKPILDNKTKKKISGLNNFLKDNIVQLNSYITYELVFTDVSIKGKYDKLKLTFISIYDFINNIINTPAEVMATDKKIKEINETNFKLLQSISTFKFD